MPQQYPVSAIAQLLKLTERRIQQLVQDGILPRPAKGFYDPVPCIHGYIDFLRRLVAGSGELSLTEERTRLTKLQADLAELELRKAMGELIGTKKATQVWGDISTIIRQQLLGLSTRLAPVLINSQSIPEIKEQIDLITSEILNELSSPDLTTLARSASGADSPWLIQAPAPPDGESVGRRKKKTKPGIKRRARKVAHRKSRIPESDDGRVQRPEGGTGDTHNEQPGGQNRDDQ